MDDSTKAPALLGEVWRGAARALDGSPRRASNGQEHPGAPPEHDDANPHARYALCQVLDRLGGDGTVAWIQRMGVKALQDEICKQARWLEEYEAGVQAKLAEKEEKERDEARAALARVQAAAKDLADSFDGALRDVDDTYPDEYRRGQRRAYVEAATLIRRNIKP